MTNRCIFDETYITNGKHEIVLTHVAMVSNTYW